MADDSNPSINPPATGAVSIHGDANGALIITGSSNNIAVFNFGGQTQWAISQGQARLSDPKNLEALLKNLDEWLQQQAQPNVFGPRLLQKLVENYRRYQDMNHPEEPPTFGEFFDRDNKMKEIRDLFPSTHLVELFGPSGMGKTHLLQAMIHEIDRQRGAVFSGAWRYLYVNAADHGDYYTLMRAFIQDMGRGCRPGAELVDQLAACLAEEIATRHVTTFLFIIDDADRLAPEDLEKLISEIGPVGAMVLQRLAVYGTGIVLRLVLAGRRRCLNQRMLEQNNRYLLRAIAIEPLAEEFVREMLATRFYRKCGREMPEAMVAERAAAIFRLTGGHPGAISRILGALEKENFIQNVQAYPDLFQKDIMRMVHRQLTMDLSLGEYLALNILGVLRRFDIHMVQKLIQRAILPADLMSVSTVFTDRVRQSSEIMRWLQALIENTGLVLKEPSVTVEPFRVHPVLRQVLPMDMNLYNPDMLRELHRQIFEIYDTNILRLREEQTQELRLPLLSRASMTMDALYHAFLCGLPSDQVLRLATDYWQLYREALTQTIFPEDPEGLAREWQKDADLRELAKLGKLLADLDAILHRSALSQE